MTAPTLRHERGLYAEWAVRAGLPGGLSDLMAWRAWLESATVNRAANGLRLHHERVGDHFEKWHIEGLPVAMAIHRFTSAEPADADPHDHSWSFTTQVLAGGYEEEVYTVGGLGGWSMRTNLMRPGEVRAVPAAHLHRIVRLLDGECWTLVTFGPFERETRFWRLEEDGVARSRLWHQAGWDDALPLSEAA